MLTRRTAIAGPLLVMAILVALIQSRALAHHSISAVYDSSKRVTIEGVVSEFRFVNPHPYLVVDVADGERTEAYHLELDNRGELAAVGMTAATLRPGDRLVITGSQSRSAPRSLYVRKLVRPTDGFEYEQVGASPVVRRGRS